MKFVKQILLHKLVISIVVIISIIAIFTGEEVKQNFPNKLPKYQTYDVPATGFAKPKDGIIRILVIDGGGMRGILPLYTLKYIEQQTKKPISQSFDLIVGSSTGAIIAVALSMPNKDAPQQPLFTAANILDIYNTKIHFDVTTYRKFITLNGLLAPLFDGEKFKKQLWLAMNNNEPLYSELLTNVIAPTYSLLQQQPVLFESWQKKLNPNALDFRALDIMVAASSAAPLLPPTTITSTNNQYTDTLIDPINILPNPTMLAIVEAIKIYPNSKYVVLSLGTGSAPPPKFYNNSDFNLGIIKWILSSYSIATTGLNWMANQGIKMVFAANPNIFLQYMRVDVLMPEANYKLALSTEKTNITLMNKYGDKMLQENKVEIDNFIQKWLVSK